MLKKKLYLVSYLDTSSQTDTWVYWPLSSFSLSLSLTHTHTHVHTHVHTQVDFFAATAMQQTINCQSGMVIMRCDGKKGILAQGA